MSSIFRAFISFAAPEQSKPLKGGQNDENDTTQKLPEGIHEVKNLDLPIVRGTEVRTNSKSVNEFFLFFLKDKLTIFF